LPDHCQELEPVDLVGGQPGRSAGVGPLPQGVGAAVIVACDPLLDGAAAASQHLGDILGEAAGLGQGDGLVADPDAMGRGVLPGEVAELLGGQVVVDVHRGGPQLD